MGGVYQIDTLLAVECVYNFDIIPNAFKSEFCLSFFFQGTIKIIHSFFLLCFFGSSHVRVKLMKLVTHLFKIGDSVGLCCFLTLTLVERRISDSRKQSQFVLFQLFSFLWVDYSQ